MKGRTGNSELVRDDQNDAAFMTKMMQHKGYRARLPHSTVPKDQTSDAIEWVLSTMTSGAVHLIGSTA